MACYGGARLKTVESPEKTQVKISLNVRNSPGSRGETTTVTGNGLLLS